MEEHTLMATSSNDDPSVLPTGAGVALVTLFDSEHNLLVKETADLAVQIVEAGASSVLVAGTVGEFYELADEERVALFEAVRRSVPAGIPVIAHVGGVPRGQAVAMAERAVDAGADVLLALPRHVADLDGYYDSVLGASGSVPVLAYHLPQAGGVIELEALSRLGVDGIKDSSGDADRLTREVLEMNLRVYTGATSLLGLACEVGATGALLGAANVWPELSARAMRGDEQAQRELTQNVTRTRGDFPKALKERTAIRWGVSPHCRTSAGATLSTVGEMEAPERA
jgi:4-hydroxy-tetrahydrodipicolinate synthase